MKSLNSGLYSLFKKKVIGYSLSSSFRYINYPLNTKSNVFVLTSKGLSRSAITNINLIVILYLIWLKVSCYFYIYLKTLLFFINFIKDIVNYPNLLIKCR